MFNCDINAKRWNILRLSREMSLRRIVDDIFIYTNVAQSERKGGISTTGPGF